jgi:membrane-associated protein
MLISPTNILTLLEHYKYFVIFPIAVVEGPIIIIISGFLVYLGYLNAVIAYVLLVVADTIGDSLYYLIGKYWGRSNFIKKIGRYVGYNQKSEELLETHFRKHTLKTILLAKFSHGLGGSVQVAAGIARIRYLEFIELNLIGTMPKTIILLVIGYYLGSSYLEINSYLDLIATMLITVIVFTLLYLVARKYVKNHFANSK